MTNMMQAFRLMMQRVAPKAPLYKCFSTTSLLDMNIGVIGAGQIGRLVCLALMKNGHSVKVCDPNTVNKTELTKNGVEWVGQALEASEGADVHCADNSSTSSTTCEAGDGG